MTKSVVEKIDDIFNGNGPAFSEMLGKSTYYGSLLATYVNTVAEACHGVAKESGWWDDIETGEPIQRNKGELLCLIHSEISEAMEGARKNLMDDKLPHRKMEEVELADAIIRICDYAGGHGLDVGGALVEKLIYNISRADHKPENRAGENGKKF